jgi:hypothetical protein
MAAFVSTPPASSPAPPAAADTIGNDGWFPSMSIAATRQILNVTTAIPDSRVRDAIVGAMLAINRQLRPWKASAAAASLAEVEQERIDGHGRFVELYERAVRAEAAAILADLNPDLSATDSGRKREEGEEAPADHHRRIATHCVRDILGKGRTKVRLI